MGEKRRRGLLEMIGRVAVSARNWIYGTQQIAPAALSYDATRPDYIFWDRFYRGKQPTAKLGGLFAKPMVEHVKSWTIGKGFKGKTGDEKTDTELSLFIRKNLETISRALVDALRLGDSYIVINADESLTLVSPDTVEVITDPRNYTKVLAYRITTRLDTMTIVDEYRADKRIVKTTSAEAGEVVEEFRNPTGRIPVIHFNPGASANEIYGHPIYEALLTAFYEYDDVLTKSLKGVKVMGTPFPVIDGVKDAAKTLKDLGATEATYLDAEGVERTGLQLDFQELDMIVTDGQFNLKGPNPFTDDSWRVLKNLFMLFMQHVSQPEWIWGGAISSSKASVDAQRPAFEVFIESIQLWLEEKLVPLCEIWLAIVSRYKTGVRALPVEVSYPPVSKADDTVLMSKVNFALQNVLIRKVTALDKLALVDDPAAEVAAAEAEAEAAQSQADRIDNWAVQRAGQPEPDEDGEDMTDDEDAAA